ncbi:glucosamine-6-phosphate deaminase [Klugiella xanthotipulae]|uniref:Glucosamine-6-phosphate deaminase n=1 Tax=Klugiella xanthotipulae TaxID=244735 RepID=A0A543I505_9MICO|nr:glucosamine-6-phosphate deaminase [Klugiella xanthotipulae]TQM65686.1 glucosamine-6-phosphate deaminase [Klugiella xanthotipulae]
MAEVIIVDTPAAAGEWVAQRISALVAGKPDAVLGLATGSTPLPVYAALERRVREEGLNLGHVRGFALDEYVGLPAEHPESYRSVIRRDVVERLGMNAELVCVPNGDRDGINTAGERYEADIRAAGGVDIQILGVGTSGHIGFNEPGSSLNSDTRVKALTEQTRRDNARFFPSIDEVPTHALTQGVGTILRAKHLVLLAFGAAKAEILAECVEGPVTASVPGSAVQLHRHVSVVVDEAAATHLRHIDYYRRSYEQRPEWLA